MEGRADGTDKEKAQNKKVIDEALSKTERKVQLRILKNRNGARGASLYYNYYAMFNTFEETDDPDNDGDLPL